MKHNGKNWRENITYEWCDNPPRRNTKANNRWLRELRKRLAALPLQRMNELLDDGDEATHWLVNCAHDYHVRVPRSLRETVKEAAEDSLSDYAGVVGVPFIRERPQWKLDPDYVRRKTESRLAWRNRNREVLE
jgi:hypothetical protein